MEPEPAMSRLEAVAPIRQTRSTSARPTRLERLTSSGQHTICAAEKQEVARPTCMGDAPRLVMYSGRLEMAIPSPSICANTLSVIGSSVEGRGSTAEAFAFASPAAFMKQGRQLGRSEAPAWRQRGGSLGCWLIRSPSLSGSSTASTVSRSTIRRRSPPVWGKKLRRGVTRVAAASPSPLL